MLNAVMPEHTARGNEVIHEIVSASEFGVIQKKLSPWEAVYRISALRKAALYGSVKSTCSTFAPSTSQKLSKRPCV